MGQVLKNPLPNCCPTNDVLSSSHTLYHLQLISYLTLIFFIFFIFGYFHFCPYAPASGQFNGGTGGGTYFSFLLEKYLCYMNRITPSPRKPGFLPAPFINSRRRYFRQIICLFSRLCVDFLWIRTTPLFLVGTHLDTIRE